MKTEKNLRPFKNLWSACNTHQKTTHCLTLGERAFLVSAARAWNSLPPHVRDVPSLLAFWEKLKTELFRLSYPADWQPDIVCSLYCSSAHSNWQMSIVHRDLRDIWVIWHCKVVLQQKCDSATLIICIVNNDNKSAHSNLGRGPHRGAATHVCRKVPIGYNSVPQIRPQKYPFPWANPQTPLPASSLDPSNLWC